ncbi:MAG: hypothetical protein FVQ79_07360 [Planctomycetes bacterium]|nr:hypothetical protein [Planctomycetota bacterium]
MKQSPEMDNLEAVLRSSKLVAGGFLGSDRRSVCEIIEEDRRRLDNAGVGCKELAGRMREITDAAKRQLGGCVKVSDRLEAWVEEAKGVLVCPWPHSGGILKRITTVRNVETGETVTWSDLNIHLIEEHGFFEGKGSAMRLEPGEIVKMIC